MKTELINPSDKKQMRIAGEIIKNGGLVAFPTETVYGLGGNALDSVAAKKIYAAKGRPSDNPLIVHLSKVEDAEKYCYTTEVFYKLAERFCPGPLTVILKKKETIPDTITAGKDTVAIRIPECKTARELIENAGVPIAAPSANISGKPSTTTAAHVIADLNGKIDAIIVGEDSRIGLESTIVMPTDNGLVLLRPGGISVEMLKEVIPNVTLSEAVEKKFESADGPVAPGMKYKHYAPKQKVIIINSDSKQFYEFLKDKGECGVLCFEEDLPNINQSIKLEMGKQTDLDEQAHKLFARLREFDAMDGIDTVYARMPSKRGIGLAVFNRLIKAAGFDVIDL